MKTQDMTTDADPGLPERLFGLINAAWTTRAIAVAAELRIAEALQPGARTADELAADGGVHAESLHRLLRALCSIGLCEERDDGRFALMPLGALLAQDHPQSLRSWAWQVGRELWPAWGELDVSVRSGKGLRQRQGEAHGFAHLGRDAEAAAVFHGAMLEITRLVAADAVERVRDLGDAPRLVDVGGGHGRLLSAFLHRWPRARGIVLDLAHAQAGAVAHLAREGLDDRAAFQAGDFFEDVPAADVLLMKAILHDWDDAHCARILQSCRRALRPGGRLLVIDRVLPERLRDEPRHRSLARSDLTMMIGIGGRERHDEALRRLLHAAGFEVSSMQPLVLDLCLVDCRVRT
jgi:SAM-dependent methyltransferase